MRLLLPSSPELSCTDRFSILDSDLNEVPFWDILQAILLDTAKTPTSLIDQLETIAIILHGAVRTDFIFLRQFLDSNYQPTKRFFSHIWPRIVSIALEIPKLFPRGEIAPLSEANAEMSFSRRQIACLVIHQFLGSMPQQPWSTDSSQDFHVWYSSDQPHPKAVIAYLTALFVYFERIVGDTELRPLLDETSAWPVKFSLRSLQDPTKLHNVSFLNTEFNSLKVVRLPVSSTAPSVLGLPFGAAVISANKNVGFGPSGTQEEVHVGSSPEACAAVLFAPTLKPTEVLIVRGAEAMVSVVGYGREARLGDVLSRSGHESERSDWRLRTMLFMDALELDEYDPDGPMPDLLPGHINRELQKAYTAFSSGCFKEIFTGLWGCGTFAGDPQIKTIIQWCAASLAGTSLQFVCNTQQEDFARRLEEFVASGIEGKWKVGNVLEILQNLSSEAKSAKNAFRHIAEAQITPSSIL